VLNQFEEHPVSKGLEQVYMQFASSINFAGDTTVKYTPILKTSELSGTKPASTYFNLRKEWSDSDFSISHLTVAAALEGVPGNNNSRMVVFGDANFPLATANQNANPDNISLFVNAIDWLSDDTGLIELRTKGATARPLDELEDGKRTFLKYLNFLLPMVLTLLYGFYRVQRNRAIRIKRMEEGYV
jgi:hypothetical protein